MRHPRSMSRTGTVPPASADVVSISPDLLGDNWQAPGQKGKDPEPSGVGILNVAAGGQADDALEVPGEVRLVVEARLRGDPGDRQACSQERLGPAHPNLRLVRMGVSSHGRPEDPAEARGAEAGTQ